MTTPVKYCDIPEEERKQLETEVRRKPSYHSKILVAMICAWILSDRIAEIIIPKQDSFWLNLFTNLMMMLCLAGGFAWALMGPVVRHAVEKEKKTPNQTLEPTAAAGRGSS